MGCRVLGLYRSQKNFWILNLHVGDACRVGLDDVVGEIDEKLGEAPLGGSVVTEDRGEGGVAKRLGQTLAKSLTRSGVVAESA